jgi:hypothetical protein
VAFVPYFGRGMYGSSCINFQNHRCVATRRAAFEQRELLSGSIGFGAGDGFAAGVDVGLSRASTIYGMAGPSFSVGFGGGDGLGGAVQISNNGGGTATGTAGFGIGGYGLGGTYGPTKLIPLVCK